jgi:hypothetical protein
MVSRERHGEMDKFVMNRSEERALVAMDTAFDMDAESDEKPLNECGWRSWDGISMHHEIRFAELVNEKLLSARFDFERNQILYRIGEVGVKVVEPLRLEFDNDRFGGG